MRVAVIIPARNEEATVARVAWTAMQAASVQDVLVVDDGSSDSTAAIAEALPGVRLLRRTKKHGKGEAMRAGARAMKRAEILVFLDADLIGLTSTHIDALVWAVTDGGCGMSCGLFDRGPLVNPFFLRLLPILTGERAMRRELFDSLADEDIRGYRVEAALNALCDDLGVPTHSVVLPGLWHRTKEEKRGAVRGFVAKQAMLATAIWSYVAFRHNHPKAERPRRDHPAGSALRAA